MMNNKSSFSIENPPKSMSILRELCTRKDILGTDKMLAEVNSNLEIEGEEGSSALAEMIIQLTECRNENLLLALSVAQSAKQTPELISSVQQILSTPSLKSSERGYYLPEIFGDGRIGWTDGTFQRIISIANEFLQNINNNGSSTNWILSPLLNKDQDVPDIPYAKFLLFEDAYYLNSGALVFKASIKWHKKVLSALFSLNKNGLKTIIVKNGMIKTSSFIHLFGNTSIKFFSDLDFGKHYYFNGNDLLYLNIKAKTGFLAGRTNVYCWDGESLNKVLIYGDEICVDQQTYTIESARLINIGHEGVGLICYKTKAPEKIVGLAIHKNSMIKPLFKDKEVITRDKHFQFNISGFTSGKYNFFSEFANSYGSDDYEGLQSHQIFSDGIIQRVNFEPANGVFKFFEKKLEKVMEVEDNYPLLPNISKIFSIISIFALTKEKILISLKTDPKVGTFHKDYSKGLSSYIVLYDKGKYEKAKYVQLNSDDFSRDLRITYALVLPNSGSSIFYSCDIGIMGQGYSQTKLFLLNDNKILDLTYDILLSSVEKIQIISSPFNGVLILAKKYRFNKKGEMMIENKSSSWFLYTDSPENGLQAAPVVRTTSDQLVDLKDILAIKTSEESIVINEKGIFQLQRVKHKK